MPRILSSVVASQVGLHQRYGGVVPEIASRAHVRQILPMIDEALRRAGVIAATTWTPSPWRPGPGLVGALVVGLTAAKTLALALDIPLIAVDHLEGHLYACQLAYPDREVYPCVGLVVSGGHTSLYLCHGPIECEFLGGTTDDAAGEAFDKVASLLGLGYPGGPEIEQVARGGNPSALRVSPVAFLHDERLLSELLRSEDGGPLRACTARTRAQSRLDPSPQLIGDLAASFQEAVVDVVVAKTRQALVRTGMKRLGVGGGVAANSRLRQRTDGDGRRARGRALHPAPALCTDNAAMAGIALPKLAAGQVSSLDIDVTAGLVRPGRGAA